MGVFEKMQDVRLQAKSYWKGQLDVINTSMNILTSTYDYNGDGTTENLTLTKDNCASSASAACNTAGDNLSSLEWSPGLFMAAKEQATYLGSATSISADHGSSTTASRLANFGTASSDAKELSIWGDADAKGVVL